MEMEMTAPATAAMATVINEPENLARMMASFSFAVSLRQHSLMNPKRVRMVACFSTDQ
jgi:hypothetical protein